MKILLALTFVFGVIYLLTMTKLFDIRMTTILNAVLPYKDGTFFSGICNILGRWFFYFSLVFQAWYWIFGGNLN